MGTEATVPGVTLASFSGDRVFSGLAGKELGRLAEDVLALFRSRTSAQWLLDAHVALPPGIRLDGLLASVFADNPGLTANLREVTPLVLRRETLTPFVDWSPSPNRIETIRYRVGREVRAIPEGDRARVNDMIAKALAMLRHSAEGWYVFVNSCTATIHPVGIEGAEFGSGSASHRPGVTWLINPDIAKDDAVEMISALIHESVHHVFHMLEAVDSQYTWQKVPLSIHQLTIQSPWTGESIPIHSAVHAWLVWYTLWAFWSSEAASALAGADSALHEAENIKRGFVDRNGRSAIRRQLMEIPPGHGYLVDRVLALTSSW